MDTLDSVLKTENRKCMSCKKQFSGDPFAFLCKECEKDAADKEPEQKESNFERMEKNIPLRYLDADTKNIDSRIINWLKEQKNEFLFIHGPCGTGKTYASCAITMRLRAKKIPCKLVFSSDLFASLRRSFNKKTWEGSEEDIIERHTGKKITIFDDVGAEKTSEYVIESWYNIINKRYNDMLPTIFTSNYSLDEINNKMSDRIASRLASGTVIKLSGADKRLLEMDLSQQNGI